MIRTSTSIAPTITTYSALYGSLTTHIKHCSCGTMFSHPTSDQCSRCSGRACACGKSKVPEHSTCGSSSCERKHRRCSESANTPTTTRTTTTNTAAVGITTQTHPSPHPIHHHPPTITSIKGRSPRIKRYGLSQRLRHFGED